MNLSEFVDKLDKEGLLLRIKKPVSVKYEIPTLMKMMEPKPLLFENVKESEYNVVANVYSSRKMLAKALGMDEKKFIKRLAEAVDNPKKPSVSNGSWSEIETDLSKLPIMTYYREDGGPYIASGIVVANDPEYGLNASYHRMMVIGKDKIVLRILPRHFNEYIGRGLKEFAICIGVSSQMAISAAISCEIGKSEISIANALGRECIYDVGGHSVPDSEIILIAEITGEEHDEGPFLDLTETFDIVRKQRVAMIKRVFAKKDALFHALLPGGMEHKTLMGTPREPTIFREVSKVCDCRDVLITPGGCSWMHGAVSIRKKKPGDGKRAIDAAFKGHSSMKHVFVVDDDIDISNPLEIEWAMATRFQADKDMVVRPNEKGSSLDPSSDLKTRETCKVGFDLTIPDGREPNGFRKPNLPMKIKPEDYTGD